MEERPKFVFEFYRNGQKLMIKINAPEVLEKQLKRREKKGECGIIAISTSTEPYLKVEEKLKITRKILEIILKYRFPVHILTKSTLVLRELDLLKEKRCNCKFFDFNLG